MEHWEQGSIMESLGYWITPLIQDDRTPMLLFPKSFWTKSKQAISKQTVLVHQAVPLTSFFLHITANPPMPTNPIDQSNHAFLEEDLSDYSFEKLRQGSQDVDISMSHYTACKLSIDLKIPDNFTGSYVVAAFHGVRGFGGNRYQLGITSCGVIFCQDHEPKTLDSCGKRPNLGKTYWHNGILTWVLKTGSFFFLH